MIRTEQGQAMGAQGALSARNKVRLLRFGTGVAVGGGEEYLRQRGEIISQIPPADGTAEAALRREVVIFAQVDMRKVAVKGVRRGVEEVVRGELEDRHGRSSISGSALPLAA